jgi:tetratricopeptide (TPR) repeat protein
MKIFDLESEIHLHDCQKKVFAFIALFIIILSTYSNTFDASWHFDDIPNILENKTLHLTALSWSNIKETFFSMPETPKDLYRPAACLSFALNYYFGKSKVFGYHLVNISIHLIASFFLYLFIYQTLNLPLLRTQYSSNSFFIALLATTLWAVNPIQTQAITYIVQRMASMAGMFYIISMYLYLKGRTSGQTPKKIIFFLLCAISAIIALGSKENAIMIPFSLLLYDFLLIQGASRENMKKNLKIFLVAAILVLGIGILYFVFSDAQLFSFFSLYNKRVFTLWERLLTQPRVIVFYISLILYPMSTRLSINHDIEISTSLFDPPTAILSIILISGILAAVFLSAKRRPFIAFSILFFFLNHIVESSIFPLELVYEHRNYIPSMLFFVPIAMGLAKAISYFSYKRSMQAIIAFSITLVIIGEGHATFMRNFTWRNEKSLWIDCVDKYPALYRSHHNLGKYYGDQDETQNAIAEYQEALKLKSMNSKNDKAITYYNLGVIHFYKKEFEKAKAYYLQALEIDPCCPGAHNNLAVVLAATDRNHEAVLDELNKAIICEPQSMQAYSNLGILLVNMEQIDEGIGELKKALAIDPANIPTLERLGYAYLKKGLLGTASIYFNKALIQRPGSVRALLYLAEIYCLSGNKEKAQESLNHFADAVQDQNLISFLDDLQEDPSLFTITPDMHIILPLLYTAYQQRAVLLEEDMAFLCDQSNNAPMAERAQ